MEYHAGTLADTPAAVQSLLDRAGAPNLFTYWQCVPAEPVASNVAALQALLPRLLHLHVFHWVKGPTGFARRPLAEGAPAWRRYLACAAEEERDRWAFIEFVPDDDPDALPAEARTLRRWLEDVPHAGNGLTDSGAGH
jgi:hypothetical protein